jgi:hypothetical protein
MRWLIGLAWLLLALGVLRVVGCSEAEAPPPECQTDEDCDDQDECTVDFCEGSCRNYTINCDDGNDCTHDECDPDTGCYYPAKQRPYTYCGCSFSCGLIGGVWGCIGDCAGCCVKGECILDVFCQDLECQRDEDCDDGNDCTGNVGMCASGACDYTAVADGTACGEGSNECNVGMCASGACDYTPVVDGTACGGGAGKCQAGSCVGTFACTEQGVRDAIAVGGGPHTFDCDGPRTVVTEAEIVIHNDVILDGEGKLTVNGNNEHTVFSVDAEATAELIGFTVTGGRSVAIGCLGGCIRALTLTNSTVSGNAGAGILYWGPLTVTNSTVSANSRHGIGGQTLTVINSTVSGNAGHGINAETLTMTNSTVSENITDILCGGTCTVTNTLIGGHCEGDIMSNGYNIESPGNTCGFDQPTDQVSVAEHDLNLGPLADNGGLTETHALGVGSVAIDQIPAVDCDVDKDQRGEPRPETDGGMCDVGAFEVQP